MKKAKGKPTTKLIVDDRLPKTKKQIPWYKNVPIIISLISILASTIVGIIAIINSRYVARLDKDIYTPNLQYEINQDSPGKIYFDIVNQGYASAEDLSVALNWKNSILLNDCIVSPPYQDVQPIQPLTHNNITYRLSSLPVNAKFRIECTIFIIIHEYTLSIPEFLIGTYTPSPAELSATPTLWIINADSTPTPENGALLNLETLIPPGMTARSILNEQNARFAEKIVVSQDLIYIDIVAENSKPATESAPRPEIIALWLVQRPPTPNTTSP